MIKAKSTTIFLLSALSLAAHAQDTLSYKADSLLASYRFEQALEAFEQMLSGETDSLRRIDIQSRIINCQNAISLKDFVSVPETVAQITVPTDEFLLWLPLEDNSWRFSPNLLIPSVSSGRYPCALYYPEGAEAIYYTEADNSGALGIHSTEKLNDTLWTYPHLLHEQTTSPGDELYPMVSPKGDELYFASDGLYGVGGYDLYVSRFNPQTAEWSTPENLGFPYSSPGNDIFFAISADERYAMLVSDRAGLTDSLTIYIISYDPHATRQSVADNDSLAQIAHLEVASPKPVQDNSETPPGLDMKEYSGLLKSIRKTKDSIAIQGLMLNDLRDTYETLGTEQEKETITAEILSAEAEMKRLTESIGCLNSSLQKMEMEFLVNGFVIDPEKAMRAMGEDEHQKDRQFTFKKHTPGGHFELMVDKPEIKFDYSFKILPTGQFAQDNTIPGGLVYQIQIFATTAPVGVKSLKGLSPVFQRNPSEGKYIYSVGLFSKYNDALANLNKVKKQGFREAFIIAFADGERISLSKARALEKSGKLSASYSVRILTGNGELDPGARDIISGACSKDILKVGNTFIIGPFDSQTDAEALAASLIYEGISGVSVEKEGK